LASLARSEPRTFGESRAQRRLFRADKKSRKAIEETAEVAREASDRYFDALRRFKAEELPPDVKRPTREEVDSLLSDASRATSAVSSMALRDFLSARKRRLCARDSPKVLGSLYNHMGRDAEAIDLFRKAIMLLDDDPVFHLNLAVNYSTQRHEAMEKFGWDLPRVFRECIASYHRARELAPDDIEIARDLAGQYVLAKHFKIENTADEALEAWKYYLSLDLTPNQRAIGSRNMGRIYLREKNDRATAIGWFEKAVELSDDTTNRMLLEQARKVNEPELKTEN